ncbi:MAG: ester cyclase [Phycisphaeraceae bacterium]|nr:MAG: ester cyclase [Phycisphaeraceae bacterium]
MSIEDAKRITREYYELVVGTGDVDRIDEFIDPAYTEIYLQTGYPLGVDGARRHVTGVREAFPDLTVRVDEQIAEGDRVASLVTARGTHLGAWLGMAPTGRLLEFTAVNVDRVVGGLIVEHGGAANLLEPLLGCGAVSITSPA